MTWIRKINKTGAIITVLIIAVVVYLAFTLEFTFRGDYVAKPYENNTKRATADQTYDLPVDADFKQAAETNVLRLKMDESTGHFIVEDKRNGNVYRSYPDPQDWPSETIAGTWKLHLMSPFMAQYVRFTDKILTQRETSMATESGTISSIEAVEGGFKIVYELPTTGFTIPMQIRIVDDYVETTIIRDGIKEADKDIGLVWVRPYPFFGAEYSRGQDGYMMIPDGSGALIRFKQSDNNITRLYDENVYGFDMSYAGKSNNRNPVIMPVFGMKAGDKGFLAVLHNGEEYGGVVASPAGVLSGYNWITSQMYYRSSYTNYTSYVADNARVEYGFASYDQKNMFDSDRSVRYYLLDKDENNYVGMAKTYREYLIQEKNVQPITDVKPDVPVDVTIIGADREKGIVSDRYLNLTTTEQAVNIVDALYQKGLTNLSVTYSGWQKNGYSSYGMTLPVDSRIGGNNGMKQFIDHVQSKGNAVYLDAEYMLNNTGGGGFKENFHAMTTLAGRMLEYQLRYSKDTVKFVSNKFAHQHLLSDLDDYKSLGVNGLSVNAIGSSLFSDYNSQFGTKRDEARAVQEESLKAIKDTLGSVKGNASNFYAMPHVDHIQGMVADYSYDVFSDQAIPFAQIASHGLTTYSTKYVNNRQENRNDFLRDIEYGAIPSFVFTAAETKEYVNAYGIRFYNTLYTDWLETAAEEYKRYNEALGDVQNQFITNHETLAPNVKRTTYSNGKSIIVNYDINPYRTGSLEVPARDFIVVQGGAN